MSYKAPEKVVTIQGEDYKGLNILGNAYAPVPRRVEAAHKNGGFSMIRQEWPVIQGIKCCEIEIDYNGKNYIGTAEINLSFGHPISDAQTSALGRALAFAGFDVQYAIASAEDMEHAANGHMHHIVESDPPALPEGMDWMGWAIQMAKTKGIVAKQEFIRQLAKVADKPINGPFNETDYRKAVEYFYRLDMPTIASEQEDGQPANI